MDSDGAPRARPPYWQLIRQAVNELAGEGGTTTNGAARDWILERYPDANRTTISTQIVICTVNQPSRPYYPENSRPRRAEDHRYDFLFRPERGKLELYDPTRHGHWAIVESDSGRLEIQEVDRIEPPPQADAAGEFALEAHLRDFLARDPSRLEPGLQLYSSDDGMPGVEFRTDVGIIDILAQDEAGGFVVVELKVGAASDAVIGQALRYRNWVRKHLAGGNPVRAIIVAGSIPDKVRYAVADQDLMAVVSYRLRMEIANVQPVSFD